MKRFISFTFLISSLFFTSNIYAQSPSSLCPSCAFILCEAGKTCKTINGCGSCVSLSTSSSSSGSGNTNLDIDSGFNGTWTTQIVPQLPSNTSSSSGSCITCSKELPICNGDVLIPNTCSECAHCEEIENINLRICIKDGSIQGLFNLGSTIKNGVLNLLKITSPKNIILSLNNDKNDKLNIKLKSRKLVVSTSDGRTINLKKKNSNGCFYPVCKNLTCSPTATLTTGCIKVNNLLEDGCGDCPEVKCN